VAAAFAIAGTVAAARFGAPPGPSDPEPPGYLMLVGSDAGDPVVSAGWGDVSHSMTFYIEVGDPGIGLDVDVYDPGLFDPSGGDAQLDVNLNPMGGTGIGEIRYILFAPDDSVLADVTWGSDTAATDRQYWSLHSDSTPDPGLYHLVIEMPETLGDTQDISIFGLRIPGHQVWSYNLTVGEAPATTLGDPMQGGATVSEPVNVHPLILQPSPGDDMFGPICGVQFVSYDMEANLNGEEPPVSTVTTRTGFSFPSNETPPSGDSRWLSVDLAGVDVGPLDSNDHGIWTWGVSALDGATDEDLFSNITPIDVNAFSFQLLDYGTGPRDFMNWPDVADRPPWVIFNSANPRRMYLPDDAWQPPARAYLGHSAEVIGGFPVVSADETSTLEVTVEIHNPHPFPLTGLMGETHVAPGAELTDPAITASNGVVAIATGRDISFSGDVAAGTTATFTYTLDIAPTMLGRGFLTGDGVDFVSLGTAATAAVYQTPYTNPLSFELPQEVLGPICQLEYEAVVPPCAPLAEIIPSEPLQTCPGTEVTLDASGSSIFNCDSIGGVPIHQWSVNGMIVEAFPDADPVRVVTPFANDEWTFEIACSTDPSGCIDAASVTFDLYEAPVVDAGLDRDLCLGDSADLEALVMSVNPPVTGFLWTTDPPGEDGDGATTEMVTVSPTRATTYTFSATDAQGCVGTGSVVITVRDPQPVVTPPSAEICPGEGVELVADAGWAGYEWSSNPGGLTGDGSTADRVTAMDVGATWTLTVTDDMGCTGQVSVDVTQAPGPTPVVTPANPQFCTGGNIGLVGEPGFVDYTRTTEPAGLPGHLETTPNIVATELGATYTLTVTDARGCTGSTSVTTSEKPPISPVITPQDPEICGPGDSVVLAGEPGMLSYSWSTSPGGLPGDGETTESIVASAAGEYTLMVTDTQNCTGSAMVTVVASPDEVPGPLGPSLRVEKSGDDDLRLSWIDIDDPVSGFDVVSYDCDTGVDRICDQDPDRMTLDALGTNPPGVPVGVQEFIASNRQRTASFLVYWKVRGLSPCSSQPGPYDTP
jgi:hypothetical protein